MRAVQDGHRRYILVSEIDAYVEGVHVEGELAIEIRYRGTTNVLRRAIVLDNVIMPRIVAALNDIPTGIQD